MFINQVSATCSNAIPSSEPSKVGLLGVRPVQVLKANTSALLGKVHSVASAALNLISRAYQAIKRFFVAAPIFISTKVSVFFAKKAAAEKKPPVEEKSPADLVEDNNLSKAIAALEKNDRPALEKLLENASLKIKGEVVVRAIENNHIHGMQAALAKGSISEEDRERALMILIKKYSPKIAQAIAEAEAAHQQGNEELLNQKSDALYLLEENFQQILSDLFANGGITEYHDKEEAKEAAAKKLYLESLKAFVKKGSVSEDDQAYAVHYEKQFYRPNIFTLLLAQETISEENLNAILVYAIDNTCPEILLYLLTENRIENQYLGLVLDLAVRSDFQELLVTVLKKDDVSQEHINRAFQTAAALQKPDIMGAILNKKTISKDTICAVVSEALKHDDTSSILNLLVERKLIDPSEIQSIRENKEAAEAQFKQFWGNQWQSFNND